MEVKSINYLKKELVDDDDFVVSGEIYIGPENEDFSYEVFEFNVISIKRLYTNFENEMGNPIMLSRGWIIVKEFNENNTKTAQILSHFQGEIQEYLMRMRITCISVVQEDSTFCGCK